MVNVTNKSTYKPQSTAPLCSHSGMNATFWAMWFRTSILQAGQSTHVLNQLCWSPLQQSCEVGYIVFPFFSVEKTSPNKAPFVHGGRGRSTWSQLSLSLKPECPQLPPTHSSLGRNKMDWFLYYVELHIFVAVTKVKKKLVIFLFWCEAFRVNQVTLWSGWAALVKTRWAIHWLH